MTEKVDGVASNFVEEDGAFNVSLSLLVFWSFGISRGVNMEEEDFFLGGNVGEDLIVPGVPLTCEIRRGGSDGGALAVGIKGMDIKGMEGLVELVGFGVVEKGHN